MGRNGERIPERNARLPGGAGRERMNVASKEQNSGKFHLKWPWNAVIYVLLALVLRLFAIPVILALMSWNKKQQPNGPEEGYCLQRTHNRLARLVWAALFLVIGGACCALFLSQVGVDKTYWEMEDYVTLVVAGGIALGGIAGGLYEGYTDIRDACFPEKSRLAKSIRSQLPYPEEAPGVKELFAMVDDDIRENGQWFDRVAIGREWVLGDDASAISRIRAVFGRNEVIRRHASGRTQTRRIVELYILDDRRQVQVTGLRDPQELVAAMNCLQLRAPEAIFRPYRDYSDFVGKSDEEWERLERDYQARLALRQVEERARTQSSAQSDPHFVYTGVNGQRTSRFDRETVLKALAGLAEGEGIQLEPLEPIPVPGLGGTTLSALAAAQIGGEPTLTAKLNMAEGGARSFLRTVTREEAQGVFTQLLEARQAPGFEDISLWRALPGGGGGASQEGGRPSLTLTDRTGISRDYDTITRRDVELAGEGLASGKYTVVLLRLGARYLYLQAGDRTDSRVTVNAGRPDADMLRVFETKTTDRQAQAWLLELYDGRFSPDYSGWRDITKQLEKSLNKK